MARSSRVILLAAIGFVGLLIAAAVGLYGLVGATVDRARIEAAASQALGMEFSLGADPGLGFLPGLRVTLSDIHIRNRGALVASAKQASIRVELLPLFTGDVRIERIALEQMRISIERGRDGQFNFARTQAAPATLPAVDWPQVSLADVTLVFADKHADLAFEAASCRMEARRVRLSGGQRADFMKLLSFGAELSCAELRVDGLTVFDLAITVDAKQGVLDLKPVTTRTFGTRGSGSLRADFSGATPLFQVNYAVAQFPVEEFFKTLSQRKVAAGRMDFSAALSMQGSTRKALRQSLKGQVSLRGKDLVLSGRDLDRAFARFESSQNFNLVDAGAVFFAGPLGLLVSKGFNFAGALQESAGSTEIRMLVSEWKVEHGAAHAQDVAMATKENRIALRGGLDLVNNRFDGLTMALVDAKGCVKVRQEIRGTFSEPVIDKPSLLTTLTGPAARLLQKGRQLLGGECNVFYAGSVAAPKPETRP
jgi:uncharacterized protein involved in outer membrane biogenesis